MKLTAKDTKNATAELMMLVRNNPGVRTSELQGTRAFHGARTLSTSQIIRLLREAGLWPRTCGGGRRTWYEWRLS